MVGHAVRWPDVWVPNHPTELTPYGASPLSDGRTYGCPNHPTELTPYGASPGGAPAHGMSGLPGQRVLGTVLWYHVGFALRYRSKRRVRTVALWLIPLPSTQPRNEVAAGDITVKVTTIVLPEVPASSLLSDPATACFAAGSAAEGRSNEALCAQVAATLRARGASWPERHMAVVAAAMRGRYESMVTAMEQANLEPVIIEDLVKFGEDRGEDRALRRMLRRVLALRKLALNADGEARIDACTDLTTLQRWLDQAVLAASADEALQ